MLHICIRWPCNILTYPLVIPQLAQQFCPRIICMGFTWEPRGTWDMRNPTQKMRILCVGIPTVGLPMHNMRLFPHVYYAHFCPCIICTFFCVGIPTVGLPMHNMRGFPHVYYAHFFPRIIYAFLTWAFPPCVWPCIICGWFAHVYYAHFSQTHKIRIFNVGIPTVGLPMHNMRCLFPRVLCAFFAHT